MITHNDQSVIESLEGNTDVKGPCRGFSAGGNEGGGGTEAAGGCMVSNVETYSLFACICREILLKCFITCDKLYTCALLV